MTAHLTTGLARRDNNPLAPFARAMLDAVSPSNRLHDSSVVTLAVNALRARNIDPLDCDITAIDAVLPEGSRLRTRAWRPFARLLAAADSAGALSRRGTELLERMKCVPSGRRVYVADWKAFAAGLGVDPGTAPVELREHFLLVMRITGSSDDAIVRMRAAIRRTELVAIARGHRAERLPRHERLIRTLLAAGAGTEQAALDLIDASHAGHRPSAHRWIDAVTARYLAWCTEHGVRALNPTEAQLACFRVERGDALGILPLRRLLAAAQG